jgi:hypothetical protein
MNDENKKLPEILNKTVQIQEITED